jgi:hypothetical protein
VGPVHVLSVALAPCSGTTGCNIRRNACDTGSGDPPFEGGQCSGSIATRATCDELDNLFKFARLSLAAISSTLFSWSRKTAAMTVLGISVTFLIEAIWGSILHVGGQMASRAAQGRHLLSLSVLWLFASLPGLRQGYSGEART